MQTYPQKPTVLELLFAAWPFVTVLLVLFFWMLVVTGIAFEVRSWLR